MPSLNATTEVVSSTQIHLMKQAGLFTPVDRSEDTVVYRIDHCDPRCNSADAT